METDMKNIAGKSAGEVARDIADFLSRSCVVHGRKEIDLATLLPDLNMKEQLSFALLSEAKQQGWATSAAEGFYLRACGTLVDNRVASSMIAAFRDPDSAAFAAYNEKYGCRFGLGSRAYWSSCLALAMDARQIEALMEYLRAFTFCLLEFAYMGDRNPDVTYAWSYYESFNRILKELTAPPEPEPLPLKVRSVGGTAGLRTADGYTLSLGLDLHNPNPARMAWNVRVDITLKDKENKVIAVIGDQINSIDPGATFHYGITRRVNGAAVAHISAAVQTGHFAKISTPVMKHLKLTRAGIVRGQNGSRLNGTLVSHYDCPLHTYALHYQFLSAENKILGGGSEWFYEPIPAGAEKKFTAVCPVPLKNAVKVVYSADFNVSELLPPEEQGGDVK